MEKLINTFNKVRYEIRNTFYWIRYRLVGMLPKHGTVEFLNRQKGARVKQDRFMANNPFEISYEKKSHKRRIW